MAQASAEKLEHTGPAEKERVASASQREQLARMPELPCQKVKEQSRLSRVEDREGERVKMSESHILARERDQSENMKRKGWTPH